MSKNLDRQSNVRLRRTVLALGTICAALVIAMAVKYIITPPPIPQRLEAAGNSGVRPEPGTFRKAIADARYDDAFVDLLQVAAEGQSASIGTALALMYVDGIYGQYREDHCKAVQWYDYSARRGQIYPRIMVSIHYAMGQGVERNPALAYYWFKQAEAIQLTYPQWPVLYYDKLVRTLELMLNEYVPEIRDPVQRAKLIVPNRDVATMPFPLTVPVADIPLFGELIGSWLYDSTGCHGKLAKGFQWIATAQIEQSFGREPLKGEFDFKQDAPPLTSDFIK